MFGTRINQNNRKSGPLLIEFPIMDGSKHLIYNLYYYFFKAIHIKTHKEKKTYFSSLDIL